jgi:integrase
MMTIAQLAPSYRGRVVVPVLGRVEVTGCTDRVMVKLVSGQSPADFAARADRIAHGFKAHLCRVRTAGPGGVVLELVRRDALAEPMSALPILDVADLRALPVGRREDGAPLTVRLQGTHLLIAGATGAGKGSYLWGLVRAMLPAMAAGPVCAWACDPKLMELAFGRALFDRYGRYAADPADIADLLEEAVAGMQARARRFAGLQTFATKTDAEIWLTLQEAEIRNGDWINPDDGKILLADYARTWIDERSELRPKTVVLYRNLLRRHVAPVLGQVAIADIQPSQVRRWPKQLLDTGVSAVTAAKAYRLLKAVLNTALDDGVIRRNPCRIKGAGQEKSAERPTLTIPQVYALADAVAQRYRALVLLAMFTSLRWGELAVLRRCDIDLDVGTVRVVRQLTEIRGGGIDYGPPKSAAGKRVVTIPEVITPVIQWHLSCFAEDGDEGLIFTSPEGKPLHHSNFRRRVWLPALATAGLADIHFHDLRHRKYAGRQRWRDTPGADGPHGSRQPARRHDLPRLSAAMRVSTKSRIR